MRRTRLDRGPANAPAAPPARCRRLPPRSAYTLIELVSVAALATILIALAVAGYHVWTRDNAVEAGRQRLQAALSRARSYALARGVETRCLAILDDAGAPRRHLLAVECRSTPTGAWWCVSRTSALPDWVAFLDTGDRFTNIVFRADGSCRREDEAESADDAGWLRLELVHAARLFQHDDSAGLDDPRYRRALEINRRTGLTREAP